MLGMSSETCWQLMQSLTGSGFQFATTVGVTDILHMTALCGLCSPVPLSRLTNPKQKRAYLPTRASHGGPRNAAPHDDEAH